MSYLPEYPELTPRMRSVLERMSRARGQPMHLMEPQAARAAYEASAEVLEVPRRALARVEDLQVPARDGTPLPARLYQPEGSHGVLLYFHGGGFTIGSVATHDILCRELAALGQCAVVSVGYRLAPEHRFPVAVDDSWDALHWLAGARGALGLGEAAPLAVGGDSAGGTLATVAALHARDEGIPLALQLLFYPGTAARQDSASHRRYHHGLVLEQAHIEYFFGHYIDLGERDDWRFSPLNAPDVDDVAPAWIGLAECDPLFDEGIAWGDTLRAAGVPVALEVWRGVTHEFIKMGRVLPESRQAHAAAGQALAEAFRSP